MRNNGLGATDVEEVDQNGDKSRTFLEDDIAYCVMGMEQSRISSF